MKDPAFTVTGTLPLSVSVDVPPPQPRIETLAVILAKIAAAWRNTRESNNRKWHEEHYLQIQKLVKAHMPSGSGFDAGTHIELDACRENLLVFRTEFHHMDDNGVYCGWTAHRVYVRPSFVFGFLITISGPNKRNIKDYIHDAFYSALSEEHVYPSYGRELLTDKGE